MTVLSRCGTLRENRSLRSGKFRAVGRGVKALTSVKVHRQMLPRGDVKSLSAKDLVEDQVDGGEEDAFQYLEFY